MGLQVTEGLGAGSRPEIGHAAAEEAIEEIRDHLSAPTWSSSRPGWAAARGPARAGHRSRRPGMGILTVGVVTKPFQFEGSTRMRVAESGINELQKASTR